MKEVIFMAWFKDNLTKQDDLVISSRVRLARNLTGYPFPIRLNDEKAREVIEKISKVLIPLGFERIDFNSISPVEAASYVEKHYVSPDFTKKAGPHTLFLNEPCHLAVMALEEDHLRIQCIEPTLSLERAYQNVREIESKLDAEFELAFDDNLGYLTQCPTNLGTGMRASVMLFLPGLTYGGYMNRVMNELSKSGLTVRGIYGEGSKAQGCIYQISNQICMGITEEDIITKINDAVSQVRNLEKEACKQISKTRMEQIKDETRRALGVMRYANLVSSSEFMNLYANVHFGINLGCIDEVRLEQLNPLLVEAMPATLTLLSEGDIKNETDRDHARAELLHKLFS